MKYSADEENHSKSLQENSNDQVSSSNETINVDEEETGSVVVKKENMTEETTGKALKYVFVRFYIDHLK